MSVITIPTDFVQMQCPRIVDVNVSDIPNGVYNDSSNTYFDLPDAYGPGDIIESMSPVISAVVAVPADEPSVKVDLYTSVSGTPTLVGTVYTILSNTTTLSGAYLGKVLTVSAWLRVTMNTGAGITVADNARMIVSHLHEA
jgi:hypothetical protein